MFEVIHLINTYMSENTTTPTTPTPEETTPVVAPTVAPHVEEGIPVPAEPTVVTPPVTPETKTEEGAVTATV
ncbi:MAG: hypothetical protein RIQ41_227 [Candidatus Parcubacteria bacterium]|jgi:hypothetical protein